MLEKQIKIVRGFPPHLRQSAAELYFDAFEKKIGWILGGRKKAIAYICRVMDPAFAICAIRKEGGREELAGIAGFRTAQGSLVGGGFSGLVVSYGFFPALWRTLPMLLLEREIEQDVLLMDGIAVAKNRRSLGIGSKLLDATAEHARDTDHKWLRLDVIDKNPRARALYERKGFRAVSTEETGPFKHVFGFSSSTQMVLKLH